MELFIPSVLLLLLAAAVVFFVLPRFGAPMLAVISVALLAFGIYQHMNAFGYEYKMLTWQYGLMNYAPYIMVGGLLLVIAFYLITISPFGKTNAGTTAPSMPEMPTIAEMPNANTATNTVTAGVNNALKGIANVAGNAAAAVGIGNAAKANNTNKGAAETVTNAVNTVKNAFAGVTNAITGNATKVNNKGVVGNLKPANNKGTRVPGLNFPISQV
jgi:hypothetical protein